MTVQITADSGGAKAMRALARRLKDYADEQADPTRQHDLKMASELITHLERLTAKLAKPAEVQLGSGVGNTGEKQPMRKQDNR